MIVDAKYSLQAANGVADGCPISATHDTSRTSFHVKHIGAFARRLEDVGHHLAHKPIHFSPFSFLFFFLFFSFSQTPQQLKL